MMSYEQDIAVVNKIVDSLNEHGYEERNVTQQLRKEMELCDLLLEALLISYEDARKLDLKTEQVKLCRISIRHLIPRFLRGSEAYRRKDKIESTRLFEQYNRAYALAARRSMYHFAKFIESDTTKSIWSKTADTMAVAFKYADRLIADDNFLFYRLSCMPGLGKTYLVNLIVANMLGNDNNQTIIRISYSDDNVTTSTKQIKNILSVPAYQQVFPWYEGLGNTDSQYEFNLKGSLEAVNYVGVTRFGQLSGKRGKVMIYDDLLKGELEAADKTICDKVKQIIIGDAQSRADDDKQKTITIGTIRSTLDPMLKQVENASEHWQTTKDKYCEVGVNEVGEIYACSIAIPSLDYETDESTCPKRYSTAYLRKQRRDLGDSFYALYQQRPKPIEGLGLSYNMLRQYDELPDKKPLEVCAFADLPRTGKNYFSMPICYNYGEPEWYFVDCIFQKKLTKEIIPELLEKIDYHEINRLCFENNTDTSIAAYITDKMQENGGYQSYIDSIYSYKNKEMKIRNASQNICRYVIFPSKDKQEGNNQLRQFMEQMTSYSFEMPNKYDDAADSMAMFQDKFIKVEGEKKIGGKMQAIDMKAFGGRF